jgi:asparagine synthase (glutamine-hydrolysing)
MFRYMALLWNTESAHVAAIAEDFVLRVQATSPSWRVVLRTAGVTVLVADQSLHLSTHGLFGGSGVVLGEIFPRLNAQDDGVPVGGAEFGAKETQAVMESQGRILASHYWGNFVAVIVDSRKNARLIFKDPCGPLPCHITQHEGVQLVFSCLGDCRELGLQFQVNWAFARARVVSGLLELREQPFTEISSVHRGECVRFNREGALESRSAYWHPSTFAGAMDPVDSTVAHRALRATVVGCTQSMAMRHSSVLAQVSGGLDSSIVLGCLGEMRERPEISCYTFFVPDSVCDERRWARYAVQRNGYTHHEVPLEPSKFAYKDLPALAPSMEPTSYFTQWQRGPIDRDLSARHGATAVFNGDGGDSVFCSTSYVFAVDHCIRRHGLGLKTLKTAASVAARRDRTVWSVLGSAMAREVFGGGAREAWRTLEPFCRLVTSDARESSKADYSQSSAWYNGLDQETLLRLGMLAFAPSFYDLSTSHHGTAPYVIAPLCSQPVYELCARIPVDTHFEGGRIRGLARHAFADEVPAPILRRQWKDRPLLQLGQIIQLNLPFIREHLLEGKLVKERILDRSAVELALRSGPSSSSAISSEVLTHLDLELWIRDNG